MSGMEIPAYLAATGATAGTAAGATAAGTAAAGTAAGTGLGTTLGSTLSGIANTSLGTTIGGLGTGAMGGAATLGSAGGGLGGAAGLTSAGTTAGGITGISAPSSFGALGGMGEAAFVPGMEGAFGTGITGVASTAPEVNALFAQAAMPSTFNTSFTVGDAFARMGKGADKYTKANAAMQMMQPQQSQMISSGPGTFEGRQRQPISPFGTQQGNENGFARYLLQRRFSGRPNGLLG